MNVMILKFKFYLDCKVIFGGLMLVNYFNLMYYCLLVECWFNIYVLVLGWFNDNM